MRYGHFYERLKRATTFRKYKKPRETGPEHGGAPMLAKTVRAGRRVRPDDAPWIVRFHRLAWPGYFNSTLGPAALWMFHVSPRTMSARAPFELYAIVWTMVCLVFAARAAFALDTRSVRVCATVFNLVTPLAFGWYFFLYR